MVKCNVKLIKYCVMWGFLCQGVHFFLIYHLIHHSIDVFSIISNQSVEANNLQSGTTEKMLLLMVDCSVRCHYFVLFFLPFVETYSSVNIWGIWG